jgi:hypothetical protein
MSANANVSAGGKQGGLPDPSAPTSTPQSLIPGMDTPQGPPYAPQVWLIGGLPSKNIDIPVTAVFLALFIGAAALHMTIFQTNRSRGHKFLISILLFGELMAETLTRLKPDHH